MWWSLIAAFFIGLNVAEGDPAMIVLWSVVLALSFPYEKEDRSN